MHVNRGAFSHLVYWGDAGERQRGPRMPLDESTSIRLTAGHRLKLGESAKRQKHEHPYCWAAFSWARNPELRCS